jgi:pantoate--beta-alanine ligase
MKKISRIAEIREYLQKERERGKTIGFVPTMGALHQGHLSLIECSKAETDLTVCSIFVNPIQFNNKSDLEKYPRNVADDCGKLEKAGCDVVFLPEVEDMYPEGATDPIEVDFGTLDKVLEGKHRPGHFNGVAIVVKKLFDIVQPNKSYFGKKDFQQLLIVKTMVEKLKLPLEIVPCPIVREADGLAMSSRNMRLTIGERQVAPRIYEVLSKMQEMAGTMTISALKKWAVRKIEEATPLKVEYLEIADTTSLSPVTTKREKRSLVILTAVYLGDIRLIDNVELFL